MSRFQHTNRKIININFLRLLLLLLLTISLVISAKEPEKGVVIVSDVDEKKEDHTSPQHAAPQTTDSAQNNLDVLNPQLVAALRQINDDPSYLKPGPNGEMVDLSQFQMDPQKLEEMIEIFDWIESQLPPDDPQQIQEILNHVEQHVAGNRTAQNNGTNEINHTAIDAIYDDEQLLAELTVLPEYLHQVDNGVDFMKMNGVPILLNAYRKYNPPLSSTAISNASSTTNTSFGFKVSSQIMHVIGVATQNNPNAIQYTHQSQLVPFIVEQLNDIYTRCKRDDSRMNGQLMNNLIFTLSSITRQSSIGLQNLDRTNGPKILYKCAKLMRTELNEYMDRYASTNDSDADVSNDEMENYTNLKRAFNKLVTMVSDIVVLNRNSLEYSRMFLQNNKWCYFMIDKGLPYHPDAVLQFVNDALERNYCVEHKMLTTLKQNLKKIIETETDTNTDTESDDDFDDFVLTQSTNLLRYIEKNFNGETDTKKTEL